MSLSLSRRAIPAAVPQPTGPVKGLLFVGRYRLDERMGRGGMGEVWRCWDAQLERTVIAKFIHPALVREPSYLARFECEMRSLAKLEHPNIVRLYGSGTDPQAYMIMELVRGITLRELMVTSERHRIKPAYAVCYAIQLADGLGVVHGMELCHRDIKPENVMISRDGRGHVTIIDLGIARSTLGGRAGETTDRLGTLGYAPPEMVLGRPTDHRGDFYQLGVVLYEMVAGRKPYSDVDESSESEMQAAHAFAAPDPIREVVTECPEALAAVIERLLAKDPEDRYQRSEEIIDDLCAVLRNTPTPDADLAKTVRRQLVRKKLGQLTAVHGERAPAQAEEALPQAEEALPQGEREAELPPPPSSGSFAIPAVGVGVTEPLRALVHASPCATAPEPQQSTLPLAPGAALGKATALAAPRGQVITTPISVVVAAPQRETISLVPGLLPVVGAPFPLAPPTQAAPASAAARLEERATVHVARARRGTAGAVAAGIGMVVLFGIGHALIAWEVRATVLRFRRAPEAVASNAAPKVPAASSAPVGSSAPAVTPPATTETEVPAPSAATATAAGSSASSAVPPSPPASAPSARPQARAKSAKPPRIEPASKTEAPPKIDPPPKSEPPPRATHRLF